jgi:hypothetical protein
MAKYAKYQRKTNRAQQNMNPIWRGIGCILIVIVPVMSYALAMLVIPPIHETGLLPRELFTHLTFPDWAYQTPVVSLIATFLSGVDNVWALLLFFLIFLLILSGLFSMVYAGIYQSVGPSRYTALDAPPSKYKGKRYTR